MSKNLDMSVTRPRTVSALDLFLKDLKWNEGAVKQPPIVPLIGEFVTTGVYIVSGSPKWFGIPPNFCWC
jgi:hypothetical protein